MSRTDTLLQRVLAANLLLFVTVLFAATLLASVDVSAQYREFLLLAMTMILVLLVNFALLRRRFHPLERLIARVEALDPADPSGFTAPRGGPEEIERLAASFRRLIERIEEERNRGGRMVLRAQEAERGRIARELHDEANQALAAITMRLEAIAQGAPPALAGDLLETKRLAAQAMAELLGLARQLRPAALDDHGLVAAVAGQVRRFREQTGIATSFCCTGDASALSAESQVAVYRVVQEALMNAGRHSGARRVDVELTVRGGAAELSVRDDGCGLGPSARAGGGLGIEGMAERARLLGGTLELSSARARGTRVTLKVPA